MNYEGAVHCFKDKEVRRQEETNEKIISIAEAARWDPEEIYNDVEIFNDVEMK